MFGKYDAAAESCAKTVEWTGDADRLQERKNTNGRGQRSSTQSQRNRSDSVYFISLFFSIHFISEQSEKNSVVCSSNTFGRFRRRDDRYIYTCVSMCLHYYDGVFRTKTYETYRNKVPVDEKKISRNNRDRV